MIVLRFWGGWGRKMRRKAKGQSRVRARFLRLQPRWGADWEGNF